MNKKLQKGLVAAVSAAMGTGIVAPVYAAAATTGTNLAADYAAANKATVDAIASGLQKDLTAARVLVDALYAKVKGTPDAYLATTLSSLLDPAQQVKLVALDGAIKKADASVKQADINAARDLILEMPQVWKETFSSAIDGIQNKLIKNAVDAIAKAQASSLQVDFDAAKTLVAELGTATNNDNVKNWAGTALKAELDKVVVKAVVTGASLADPSTITLTGSGLYNLQAANVAVEGSSVASITSAGGYSATVTLGTKLGLNREYKVTVTEGKEVKEFTVKNGFVVSTVEVTTAQIDDDKDGQELAFNVNGAPADLDFLTNVAGYTVEYQASKPVFAGTTNLYSSSAEIDEAATDVAINKSFDVKVVLRKDGNVYASAWKTVSVKNLNETAPISSIVVKNYGSDKATAAGDTNDFTMNSSTLVVGEKAAITELHSATDDLIVVTGGFTAVSSNVGVATVTSAGVITAVAPGTATITVTAGTQTYSKTITVTNSSRAITTLTPAKSSYTLQKGLASYSVSVSAKDQFGDPIAVLAADVTETSDLTVGNLTAAADGKATMTVAAGSTAGTYPVYLKVGGAVLGSFNVVVTNDTLVNTTKIESTDNSLDIAVGADNDTVVKVNQYTTAGGFIESLTGLVQTAGASVNLIDSATPAKTYTLSVQDATIANVAVTAAGSSVTVTGLKTGSTKLVLKNSDSVDVAYFDITVVDGTIKVSSIAWKTPATLTTVGKAVKVGDALTLTKVDGDDIVNGLTLTKSTTAKVRVNEDDTNTAGRLMVYLDVNDDANYVAADDIAIGTIGAVVDDQFASATALTVASTVSGWTGTNVFSRALAAGDKGSLIFTFRNASGDVVSSSVLPVDVK